MLNLQIPKAVTMTGGIYLWKDGREVPDTMNVSMEQPEEMLFSWDSGFGNNQLGVTEDVLGTDGTISKAQQIRYTPAKGEPPGRRMSWSGATTQRSPQRPHAEFLRLHPRRGKETNCPFDLGFRVSSPAAWRSTAIASGATMRWDAEEGRDRVAQAPCTSNTMEFEFTPEQIQLRKTVREFAEAEIRSARAGVGRSRRSSRWK